MKPNSHDVGPMDDQDAVSGRAVVDAIVVDDEDVVEAARLTPFAAAVSLPHCTSVVRAARERPVAKDLI